MQRAGGAVLMCYVQTIVGEQVGAERFQRLQQQGALAGALTSRERVAHAPNDKGARVKKNVVANRFEEV